MSFFYLDFFVTAVLVMLFRAIWIALHFLTLSKPSIDHFTKKMNKCNEITVFCGVLKAPQLHTGIKEENKELRQNWQISECGESRLSFFWRLAESKVNNFNLNPQFCCWSTFFVYLTLCIFHYMRFWMWLTACV